VSILLAGLKVVGTIPTSIGLLSTLTSLSISRNSITSTVPSQLGQLKLLASIDLSVNSITGYIPKTLCSDSALTSLSFGSNPLGCYFNCLSSVASLSTGTINPVCSDGIVDPRNIYIYLHYFHTLHISSTDDCAFRPADR